MTKSTVTKNALHRADKKVARKASRHRGSQTIRSLGAISEIGDQPPLRAIGVAIVTTGLLTGRPRLAAAGMRALAAHTVATWAKAVIKGRVDRTRPNRWLGGSAYQAKRGRSNDPGLNSFPSGHTAGAVAIAAALARDYPQINVPVNSAAAAIAAVQLPRGKHHLSDIVVGALIGGGAEWLVSELGLRVRAKILAQPAASWPASSASTHADAVFARKQPARIPQINTSMSEIVSTFIIILGSKRRATGGGLRSFRVPHRPESLGSALRN